MKNLILTFCISTILILSCDQNDDSENKNYPKCIETIINETLEQSVGNPRAKIDKFNYMNMIVYVYQHGYADPISVVYRGIINSKINNNFVKLNKDKIKIICVGRLDLQKNQELFVS